MKRHFKTFKVSGYPEPEIIWSKDRHVMTDDELNGIITDRGALIFPAVTIENQGTVRNKTTESFTKAVISSKSPVIIK